MKQKLLQTVFMLSSVLLGGCHQHKAIPVECDRLLICNDGFMIHHMNSIDSECSEHGGAIDGWVATRMREGKHWRIVFTPKGESPDDVKVDPELRQQ